MKLFDEKGYINVPEIRKIPHTFLFIFSARGTGKTVPVSLDLIAKKEEFIYLRRTETELFSCLNEELSPFKKANKICGSNINFESIKGNKNSVLIKNGEEPCGIGLALSTLHNIRGFDAQEKNVIFYDECVQQLNVRQMKGEDVAILHAYETINRNRELEGKKAIELICCGNSDNLDAAIFSAFNLYPIIEKMTFYGNEIETDEARGIIVVMPKNSPISQKKAETALYKATSNEEFTDVAINNNFAQETYFNLIKKMPLAEFVLRVSTNKFRVFVHKSTNIYYVVEPKGAPDYELTLAGAERFYRNYLFLSNKFYNKKVYFENYKIMHVFKDFFGI